MGNKKKKGGLFGRLSIPVKIILFSACSYLLAWSIQISLSQYGMVDFSKPVFGIALGRIYLISEMIFVALSASVATYLFLDRPLHKLFSAVRGVENGNFLVRAPVLYDDELGKLSHALNSMLLKLTDLSVDKIQADQDAAIVYEQVRLKNNLEEKNAIIKRNNNTLEHLVKDLSLIYEIGQEVSSIVDLDDLYRHITDTLRKHLTISEFAILVLDENKEEMHVKSAYGFPDDERILKTAFRIGEGISGLAAETGRKIYIKDTTHEERFLHYKGEKPRLPSSFLSIPLIYKEDIMGVINFARRGVSSFTFQDVKMLSLVANQVALAIANARLYTKTRELSVKDELTGINNRRYFHQMLQMEWKRAIRFKRELSLVMLDVDYFKLYNDSFGHVEGDRALAKIGQILKRNLREVDTVARFGGEEFVLLLPDTDKRGAIAVAEKVRLLVEGHAFLSTHGKETRLVTISAGVATYPNDMDEMDDLINYADIALYKAKEYGRNRVECYKSVDVDNDEDEPKAGTIAAEGDVSALEDDEKTVY